MSTSTLWLDENKTIFYFSVTGQFSRSEARRSFMDIQNHVNSVDHKVDIIIDCLNSKHGPKGMLALVQSHLSQIRYRDIYLVGFPTLPRMIAETLNCIPGVFDQEPIFVDTLEDALERLNILVPIQLAMMDQIG